MTEGRRDEILDQLRALSAKASDAPWQWLDGDDSDGDELQDGHGEMIATQFRDDIVFEGERLSTDGRLCAAMRNALPAILEELAKPHVFVVIGPERVHGIYVDRADADEDVDIRSGRGARPDLEGRYRVEPWKVMGEDSVARRARRERGDVS